MIFDFLRKKDDQNIIKDPIKVPVPRVLDGDTTGMMEVEDVFSIKGRGTVATGRVQGTIRVGQAAVIEKTDGTRIDTVIDGVETFRKLVDYANDGDNCGLLLRGIDRPDVERDDIIKAK